MMDKDNGSGKTYVQLADGTIWEHVSGGMTTDYIERADGTIWEHVSPGKWRQIPHGQAVHLHPDDNYYVEPPASIVDQMMEARNQLLDAAPDTTLMPLASNEWLSEVHKRMRNRFGHLYDAWRAVNALQVALADSNMA